jgi:hypothetical protein
MENVELEATRIINEAKRTKPLNPLLTSNPLHNLSIHERNK